MYIDKKSLSRYIILFVLYTSILLVYTFFTTQNYLLNIFSFVNGSGIFFIISLVYFYLANRHKNSKMLTSGYVIYEVIYAFFLKFLLLILLFLISFKLFNLNDKIVIISFVIFVFSRIFIYLVDCIYGKNSHLKEQN